MPCNEWSSNLTGTNGDTITVGDGYNEFTAAYGCKYSSDVTIGGATSVNHTTFLRRVEYESGNLVCEINGRYFFYLGAGELTGDILGMCYGRGPTGGTTFSLTYDYSSDTFRNGTPAGGAVLYSSPQVETWYRLDWEFSYSNCHMTLYDDSCNELGSASHALSSFTTMDRVTYGFNGVSSDCYTSQHFHSLCPLPEFDCGLAFIGHKFLD